jgi:hypothetical protein
VANTAQSAQTTPRGALRVREAFSRIYGTLAILFGFIVMIFGLLAILARSMGRSYEGIIEIPDAVPSIAGPYSIVVFLVFTVLGISVFRQRMIAAVGLLVFILVTDALSYFFPALNVDGDASYSVGDMAVEAISLILTTIVVIADRAARSITR